MWGLSLDPAHLVPPSPAPTPQLRPLSPQAHSVCSAVLAPECGFGRLRSLVLPPACVRLLPGGFSKTQSFRIAEAVEPGEVRAGRGALGWGLRTE